MRWTLPLLAAALLAQAVSAQMSFPMLTSTLPTAVRRGTTAEVVVESQQPFGTVYKVLIEGAGVTAEAVPGKSPKSLRLKVTASADASLGVREFRTASELGVSSLGQLLVVDDPVVPEAPGNGTPATAQPVTVPCVVCGRIETAENVD